MDTKKNSSVLIVVALLILIGGGVAVYAFTNSQRESASMMEKDAMMQDEEMMASTSDEVMEPKQEEAMMDIQKGSYEAYSSEKLLLAKSGKVVLFFKADWCPTCRALDANIKENTTLIPEGVTILEVNYDTSTALKQKYGVTSQHTLVQVAADGSKIATWQGTPTLAGILSHLQ